MIDLERSVLTTALAESESRVEALRADQADWRKGVAYIAAAVGLPEGAPLSPVDIAQAVLAMRAEVERIRIEIVGACTDAGSYMLVDSDPTAPGEIRSAVSRITQRAERAAGAAAEGRRLLERAIEHAELPHSPACPGPAVPKACFCWVRDARAFLAPPTSPLTPAP